MKSYNHLFEQLITPENIKKAIWNSSVRKRDRADVKRVIENIDKYVAKIQDILINKTYTIQKHKAVQIYDGSSKKSRLIIQPKYIYEQIIHHAVVQVLQPIFMKGMYEFSCGSIPDRGSHYGKRHIEKFIKRNNNSEIKYCLKLDIRHYYQNVDTNLIKRKFRKIIHDERMLYVLDLILDSNKAEYNGNEVDMGLPIGYYTSQWFANWFLQDLDHFIKEKLHTRLYVRYVDDIVLFGSNKKKLYKDFEEIRNFLESLHLEVKGNYQVFKFDFTDKNGIRKGRPLDFMGFKFFRDKTTLRRSIMLKCTRKARCMYKKECFTWFDCSQLLSYMGWFKHTDTYNVYLKFIKPFVNIESCKRLLSKRQQKKNKETENGTNLGTIGKQRIAACY